MAKSKIERMREMAEEIQRRSEAFANTPEGEDFDIQMEFATKLLKAMKAKRMTKTDLCERVGMKAPQFSKIIQGEANITITTIGRIAKGVGVPPSRLMPNKLIVGTGK